MAQNNVNHSLRGKLLLLSPEHAYIASSKDVSFSHISLGTTKSKSRSLISLKKTTYTSHIMDWDSNNHKIISLFRTTLDYSICMDFGSYDTIKELWDALAFRYTRSDALLASIN
jgi:hypothetical protein